MVLEDLPPKLGHKDRVNVGIRIPAPWSIWDSRNHGYHEQILNSVGGLISTHTIVPSMVETNTG